MKKKTQYNFISYARPSLLPNAKDKGILSIDICYLPANLSFQILYIFELEQFFMRSAKVDSTIAQITESK